jgi:SAM-dependent methyltransferase
MASEQPPLEHGFTAVDAQEDPQTWIRVLDTLGREPFYVAYKRRLFEMVAPDPDGRYLDVGGGIGGGAQALVVLTEARAQVVVVDRSLTMATEASQRGTTSVVGMADTLPFGAAFFDGAWADRTFQHLIDPELALAEMLRVTRAGGRVVVVDPDYDTQVVDVDDQDLARRVLRFRADHLLRNGTLAHQMPGRFVAAGLVDVQIEAMTLLIRDHTAVDNVMGLRSWATTANEHGLLDAEDAPGMAGRHRPSGGQRPIPVRRDVLPHHRYPTAHLGGPSLSSVSSGAPWARTWSWSRACSRA